MKEQSTYSIDIYQLSIGSHEFTFQLNEKLFANFENSPVNTGKGDMMVMLDKQERLLTVNIAIDVTVPLVCDKSLKEFDHRIISNEEVLFKYGAEEMELDDNIIVITQNTQRIDLAQFLYEFICIEIPMKKVHPDHRDENTEDELIYTSGDTDANDGQDSIDPRWSGLKDLK